MRATLSIGGVFYPMIQATLRRDAAATGDAQLTASITGLHVVSVGAAVELSVEGGAPVYGVVAGSTPGAVSTDVSIDVPAATGSGVYAPDHLYYRSSLSTRGDFDLSVAPGDTLNGATIARVVHVLSAESLSFTEVSF